MSDMTGKKMTNFSRPEYQNHRPVEIPERLEKLCLMHKEELSRRTPGSHKGSYGKLLIIAGSPGMAGAAYLSGLAAFRAGIGMVRYLGPEANRAILQTLLPEAMYDSLPEPAFCPDDLHRTEAAGEALLSKLLSALDWADYLIAGPGLSRSDAARSLMHALFSKEAAGRLQTMKLIVLDADALNIMAEERLDPGALPGRTVITPHMMEMSRLCGMPVEEILLRPEETALHYAAQHRITVVLKDAVTTVSDGQETMRIASGCAAMAKAGSGDVLTGCIAGTAAMLHGNIADAVPVAVHLHGTAGCIAASEQGSQSILARDIAESIGKALAEVAG